MTTLAKSLAKSTVASLASPAIAAGLASHAGVETYKKKRLRAPHAGTPHSRVYGYRDRDDSIAGYYEHRLDAVRLGSQTARRRQSTLITKGRPQDRLAGVCS